MPAATQPAAEPLEGVGRGANLVHASAREPDSFSLNRPGRIERQRERME